MPNTGSLWIAKPNIWAGPQCNSLAGCSPVGAAAEGLSSEQVPVPSSILFHSNHYIEQTEHLRRCFSGSHRAMLVSKFICRQFSSMEQEKGRQLHNIQPGLPLAYAWPLLGQLVAAEVRPHTRMGRHNSGHHTPRTRVRGMRSEKADPIPRHGHKAQHTQACRERANTLSSSSHIDKNNKPKKNEEGNNSNS